MQILSGYFPAQKPLGTYYYSQDQVQPPTSDPPPSEAYPPGEAGFHLTYISRHSFQVLNPPQGTDSPFSLHRMLSFPAPQRFFTS